MEEYAEQATSVKAGDKQSDTKRRSILNGLHGVTSQKIEIFSKR
jgi:hypothetical protein